MQTDKRGNQKATAPDKRLALRRHAVLDDGRFDWQADVRLGNGLGGHQRLWHAFFDDRTPHHLLAGFATALAETGPAQRGMYDVPHTHLVKQERAGPQGEALIQARAERLAASWAAARKARRTTELQAQRTPAASPTPLTRGR